MKTILILDDDKELAEMLTIPLVEKGYDVITAASGKEGLEKLTENEVDLIILDLKLTDMSGLEFFSKVSTPHGRSKYPILVMTGRSDLETVFQDIDVEGFIAKPCDLDDFMKAVDRIITARRTRGGVFLIDIEEKAHTKAIREALERENYRVIVAEGITMLREKLAAFKPDCIVMEYMQDDLPGSEFIARIKEILAGFSPSDWPGVQTVPVIVYTVSRNDIERESLASGADVCVKNPSDPENIVTEIRKMEQKNKGRGEEI